MLSFFFPFMSITVLKIFSNMFFSICMTSRLWQKRLVFNKEAPRKYFTLSNYGLYQNQEISAYSIENQTQCHRTPTLHYTILHLKEAAVQHPFQLCQQEVLFVLSELVICWQEPPMTVKKERMFYRGLLAWMVCYFPYSMDILVFHACSNQKPFHKLKNHW